VAAAIVEAMEKIKVFHVITRLVLGGAQQNTLETCRYLNPARFDCRIICGPETGAEGQLHSDAHQAGIPLIMLPELVREPHPLNDLAALIKIKTLCTAARPQIIHTHSSKAGIVGRWAAWLARVPVIVHTVHGWGHTVFKSPWKRAAFTMLERLSARITDRLITVSCLNAARGLQDSIGRPEQYETIHSSIDLADFSQPHADLAKLKQTIGIKPGHAVVGTVGRLSAQKNPRDFISAAAAIKKIFPQVQFLFIGDGPLRPETERLIREQNLDQDMLLLGLRRDVPDLLHCMDIFILTSLWEGLPRVIPQAMAAGLPVVANAVDGVCEVVRDGENGYLIQPGDVVGMARKVTALLTDSALRQTLAAAGRATAARDFSLQAMIGRLESLYENLLASSGQGG